MYTYSYGLNNELQEVQIPGLGSITIPEYTWNRPKTVVFPGGSTRNFDYDPLMRLQRLTANDPGGNALLDYQYDYDPAGNITAKTTEHGNYTFGYDPSSRLTSADHPVLDDETYTYDHVGNRTAASNATGSISHNENNELLFYGEVEYTYDANGNLTQKKVVTLSGVEGAAVNYIYNAENRLVKVEDDLTKVVIAEYGYDPFGRRLWKEVGGTKTYFFYSEEGLIAEYDASGVEIRSYGYKPDSTWSTDPLWLKEDGAYYWYQNDHLGTPQKLVDSSGTVVWSAQYTAFGEATVDVEMIENNLRFPGQYYDAETGLHYNFQRYYEPGSGRYMQTDPIGFDGGDINLYGYGKNSPVGYRDPLGLLRKDDIAEGRTVYTCQCGWIDTIHLEQARDYLFNTIWREIVGFQRGELNQFINLRLNQRELILADPATPGSGSEPFTFVTGIAVLDSQVKDYTMEQLFRVAFDIFFDFETAFEQHQARLSAGNFYTHSGFSVEDLPSDFLGFLEGVNRISNQRGISAWKTLCGDPLSHDENVAIFEAAEKFQEVVPWTNHTHIPKLWIKENNEFTQFLRKECGLCPCNEENTRIPPEFRMWHPNTNSRDYKWALISEHFACYEFHCLRRLDHPGWQRN